MTFRNYRYMARPRKRKDGCCKAVGCERPVGHPQRHYCSAACQTDTDIRCGVLVGSSVFERDKGVCAECGLDTRLFERVMKHLDRIQGRRSGIFGYRAWADEIRHQFGFHFLGTSHYWEADHIVPVSRRPASELPCGLDGYRTLCVPCHHTATALLRRRA